jgi:ribosomal protein L30E
VDTIHDEGWVKLHRKIERSAVFQNEGLLKVWIWCLIRANHDDKWVPVRTGRGTTQVLVKKGQFIFGRKTAAKALKMKEPTVQKRMMVLRNLENLIIQSNSHYSIVTIINLDTYQSTLEVKVSPEVSGKYQASITNKNYKNEKKLKSGRKKEPDPRVKEFLNFWGEAFQKETGQPYVFSFDKERSLAKGLLKVHSLETIKEMTKIFFKDEQAKRRGLTIGILYQEINRLLSLKAMSPLEEAKREAQEKNELADGVL